MILIIRAGPCIGYLRILACLQTSIQQFTDIKHIYVIYSYPQTIKTIEIGCQVFAKNNKIELTTFRCEDNTWSILVNNHIQSMYNTLRKQLHRDFKRYNLDCYSSKVLTEQIMYEIKDMFAFIYLE